jgi:hypothetical protein
MEKFKLFLVMLAVVATTLFAVAKFLLFELEEFWHFLQHLQW